MKEIGIFSPLENLVGGLFEVALGIGAIALVGQFLKRTFTPKQESKEQHKNERSSS